MAFPLTLSDILALTALATHISTALLSAPHQLRAARHKIDALVLEIEQAHDLVAHKATLLANQPAEAARLQRFLAIFDGALRDCGGILERYAGGKKMGGVGKVKWVVADEKRFEEILATLEFVVTRFDSFLARMDEGLERPGRVEVEQEEEEENEGAGKKDKAAGGGGGAKGKPAAAYAQAVQRRKKEGGGPPAGHARVPGTRLECYTLLRATGVMGGKLTCEREQRGQWKLREMAQDFVRAAHGGIDGRDERVAWLLRARAEDEHDPRYRWLFLAARLEKKGTVGFVAAEEVMVIVKREMTPAAKRESPCHQGSACYRPDCPYKHPSPCCNGGRCRWPTCRYKHAPACRTIWDCRTPGCKFSHLTLCRRGTRCDVSGCKYVHRDRGLCRNGIECKTSGCVYTHIKIQCRYKPCRTPNCSFNHLPGQVQTPDK
ncbi:hypothetical protein HETSPECPRED_000220 [Neofusicoccum parvum]|nr:hypothetical protein HETSPECPRED_000220 [Neofusicoccum parvum]